MSAPLLHIDRLSVKFDTAEVEAVKDLSLELYQNQTLAIVGESGSGKSVTALSILQLISSAHVKYPQGHIWFSPEGGERTDLLSEPLQQLRSTRGAKISMVFQEPMTSLNPVLTCGEQVAEAIQAHENISRQNVKQRVIELFTRVELPDPDTIYRKYPHQLSGGQKQRVMIAMAMSTNPLLLICDEPTTALDVTVQKSIIALIHKLQAETKMAVIFISHDLALVSDIATHIAVMYQGQLVEYGEAGSLIHAASHPYTRALLACRPANHPKSQRLPVVGDFIKVKQLKTDVVTGETNMASTTVKGPALSPQSMTIQTTPLVSGTHIGVEFRGPRGMKFNAVDDVTIVIGRGETVGLAGGSGSGKTTLGRALLRLVPTTAGTINFDGMDITSLQASRIRNLRSRMQLIFQDPYSSLNPRIRIGEAIMEAMQAHKKITRSNAKNEIIVLLEKVGLGSEHFMRYPHEFSGGQRQRVVIARALSLKPEFIVCDESVSALDVSVQAQVINLLNDLKKEFGFSALFISHDLALLRYVSDRLYIMHQGKIVEEGLTEAVYDKPAHPYTRELISSIPGSKLSGR